MMTLEEAKKRLDWCLDERGNLFSLGHYVSYDVGERRVSLDDKFDVDELEAIVVWVKAHSKAKMVGDGE